MTAACAPVSKAGAIPESCAARTPRISSFWLAYAAGQEEAVAVVAALAARDAGDGGDADARDALDSLDAMPMDEWLALSDDERAAIVAAYLAPDKAPPPPRPRRGAFDPLRAAALLGALRSGASLTCAARALGIGRTTIRRWMAERPDFAAQVDALRAPLPAPPPLRRRRMRPAPDAPR